MADLVAEIRSSPQPTEWYIGGYAKLDQEAKCFLVQSAISSRVADAVLILLAEDNRIVRQLPEIKAALLEEMDWIVSLPEFVWRKLGELAGQTSHQLRHSCIAAGHTTIAFFRWRCLLVYERRPFSICQGYIGRNLRTLAEETHEPTDPILAKVWPLMKLGWPENQLKRGSKASPTFLEQL